MEDFNILGTKKTKKSKKEQGLFSDSFDFGLAPTKNQKNSFNTGFGFRQSNSKPKYERVPVTSEQKKAVLFRQKDKCAWSNCRVHFHRDGVPPHFDHIKRVDRGGGSSIKNIQALCPNHHQLKTHKENLKEIEKKRKTPRKKESSGVFGGGSISRLHPKRSKNSLFGF